MFWCHAISWSVAPATLEKREVGAADNYWPLRYGGQLFNIQSIDKWNPKKRPSVSLYLNELLDLNLKCKFRDQVEGSNILTSQVFPEGLTTSGRTDVSNTLAQNCHCEFRCGMHLACKNICIIRDRNGSVKGPEKHWEAANAIARELRQHAPTRTTNIWDQLIGRNWVKIRLAGSELSQLLWRRLKPHWKKVWIAGTVHWSSVPDRYHRMS